MVFTLEFGRSAVNNVCLIIILFLWRPSSTLSLLSLMLTYLLTYLHTHTQNSSPTEQVQDSSVTQRPHTLSHWGVFRTMDLGETFLFLCSNVCGGTAQYFGLCVKILRKTQTYFEHDLIYSSYTTAMIVFYCLKKTWYFFIHVQLHKLTKYHLKEIFSISTVKHYYLLNSWLLLCLHLL